MSKPDLSTYGGRLRDVGYAGEIVDQNYARITNKVNEGAAALGFGVAVARGAADNTCKKPAADGDEIIGISARHAIRPATSDGNNTVQYNQYDAVPVIEEGLVYAIAGENVSRGDKVVNITATNKLGSHQGDAGGGAVAPAPAVHATGSLQITVLPTDGDTVTIAGTAVTFVAVAAAGKVTIGADIPTTLANLVAFCAASADANLVKCTYLGNGVDTMEITAVSATAATGNALTLVVSNAASITKSGATLAGGVDAVGAGRVLLPRATWETTTAANSVGIVKINR